MPQKEPARRYDKGERRMKHVGQGDEPEFVIANGDPKHIIGKCPSTIPDKVRDRLLNEALPTHDNDIESGVQKRIYAVYRGAIYEAQTSDQGYSYHAYPFKGKLRSTLIEELRKMAIKEECRDSFERWVKTHVTEHGR